MQKQYVSVFILCVFFLTGCNVSNQNTNHPSLKSDANQASKASVQIKTLDAWWSYFNDPVLDRLVSATVKLQMQGTGNKGEKAKLVSDVVKSYLQYRSLQGQGSALNLYIDEMTILTSRLDAQEKKNLVTQLNKADTDTAAARKSRESISNEMGTLQKTLASSTGLLAEYIAEILKDPKDIPAGDIKPILITPANNLAYIPEIRGITAAVPNADTIFPKMAVGDLFGVSSDAYTGDASKWSVQNAAFKRHLNWSVAETVNTPNLQNDISDFLFSFQGKLISYADLGVQYETLEIAHKNAIAEKSALPTHNSRNDGASLQTALDLQKKLYDTNMAALKAKYERIKILVDLYSLFNVY